MDTLWIQINLRSFINQMDASTSFITPFWSKCRFFCNVVGLWQRYKYTVDASASENLTRTLSFAENIETEQDRFQETTDLLSHVLEMKPTKQQDDLVCKCVPQKLNLAPFIIREWAKVLIMQHCATLPVPVSYCSKLRLDALIECVFLITRN